MKRLAISPSARSDLVNIREYIAAENKRAATRIIREIETSFKTLLTFPELGRRRDQLRKGLRSFPIEKYVVFYFVTEKHVKIARVLHGSQDIDNMFDE